MSNPPFYKEDYITSNISRNQARFTQFLTFKELIQGVSQILSKSGFFSTIIPFKEDQLVSVGVWLCVLHVNVI